MVATKAEITQIPLLFNLYLRMQVMLLVFNSSYIFHYFSSFHYFQMRLHKILKIRFLIILRQFFFLFYFAGNVSNAKHWNGINGSQSQRQ